MKKQRKLHGLEKICKLYGQMQCGDTLFRWDYAADKAVMDKKMPIGSERWKQSEKARMAALSTQ